MRLKVYQAPNIGAAMAMVRDELGPDALILANRAIDGGVELTAAQEFPPPDSTAVSPGTPVEWPLTPPPPSIHPVLSSEIARSGTLRWHGVPAGLAARLGRGDLATALANELKFHELPCRPGEPPLLLVGPPGAGKTLTVARLATRLKLSGQTAMVITCDGLRAGAAEQLAAFTRLLGFTLIVAETPQQLARAIARRAADQPVLIDMPGLDPFDAEDQNYIRECQAVVSATIALVLPAGLDPADAEDLATGFMDLGATSLIATRLDQSRRLGGLLAAADRGLAFTDAGISAAVANGLTKVTPAFIAERLSYARSAVTIGQADPVTPPSPLALLLRTRSEQPRSEP
jgi:flagellar biosynthesis protein FlhF